MRVIVSNDWKRISFSKMLKNKVWDRGDLENNHGKWRTDDKVIDAIIELQGKAFDEMHDGVTIVEYNENECHPVIDEEEYGGENLYFEKGKGEIEWGYACSYNPMNGECDDDSAFDMETDTYHVEYDDTKSVTVEGSRQLAKKIIYKTYGHKKEVLEKLMKYSSCRLHDIEMAFMLDTEQLDAYLYLFCCCTDDFVNRDFIHIWAMMYDEKTIRQMNNKFRYAESQIKEKIEPLINLLETL